MDAPRLIEIDDHRAIEFTLEIHDEPAETVWDLAATPAGLERSFPSRVDLVPAVGGDVWFSGDELAEDTTGTVTVFHMGRQLGFTWGDHALRLEVEAEEDAVLFRLTDILPSADTAARNAAGWQVCLARFRQALGEDVPTPEWREVYDALVADGWPHGAAFPGMDGAEAAGATS